MKSELPASVEQYAQSPVFDNHTIPKAFKAAHSTKPGVWGRLKVLTGSLDFTLIGPPKVMTTLNAGEHHIFAPTAVHLVSLKPDTSFQIDFLK
jgi:tellurite resistance-related uncharacterized protein